MAKSIKRNHQIIISIATVIIVAIATVAVFYAVNRKDDADSTPELSTPVEPIHERPADYDPDSAPSAGAVHESEKSYYDTTDANASNEITGVLSSIGVQGDWLAVIFTLDQYLPAATCDLKFGDLKVAGDASVSATTSTCSFRLPADHFAKSILYEYRLVVTSEDKSGTLAGETSI